MNTRERPETLSLEEQVALLDAQLLQAQKLGALGELLGTTTHEFNNVLMTILNYSKIGLRNRDQATRDRALEKIHAAAQRAAKITNSVLAMARNRGERPEPTDLATLADETLVLLERELAKYRIAVERQFPPVPPALVNGNQIQQVLLNLVVNARQAMPSGGRLLIRLDHDPAHGWVELTLRDTGTGIAPERLPRIFDRFYTTKSGPDESGKGGTGLGLAACRRIIESHRGRIRVESAVGKGTAFIIKLPVAPPAPPPAPPLGAPLAERPAAGRPPEWPASSASSERA